MVQVTKNFIMKNKVEDGSWEILYPRTTAAQVITAENARFVTDAQIAAWEAKATKEDVSTAIAGLVDSAPEQLNTLKELADAITAHESEYDALLAVVGGKASAQALNDHIADKNNPHGVTAAQVGLGNVDNTADIDKPISTAVQAALNTKADASKVQSTSVSTTEPAGVPTGSFWFEVIE